MPTLPGAQAARRLDLEVRNLLLSGFLPENIARRLGLSVDEVLAAALRMEDEAETLDADGMDTRDLLARQRAVYMQAMQAWQRSVALGQEAAQESAERNGDSDNGKTRGRATTNPVGDPRFLTVALKALSEERQLRKHEARGKADAQRTEEKSRQKAAQAEKHSAPKESDPPLDPGIEMAIRAQQHALNRIWAENPHLEDRWFALSVEELELAKARQNPSRNPAPPDAFKSPHGTFVKCPEDYTGDSS